MQTLKHKGEIIVERARCKVLAKIGLIRASQPDSGDVSGQIHRGTNISVPTNATDIVIVI